MIKIRPSFRWILQCPDISRHLENRLRQIGCSGVFGMIKLNFAENSIKRVQLYAIQTNPDRRKNNYLCR